MRSLPLVLLGLSLPVFALGARKGLEGAAPTSAAQSAPVPAAAADDELESGGEAEPASGLTQEGLEEMSRSVRADVEALRGVEFPRDVEVVLTDLEGFRAYVERRIAALQSPEDLRADELAAKLLGVVPPELDLMAVTQQVLDEQVGGFYDPGGNAFYLLDRFDGVVAEVFLAHELTHALDDQLYDIDGTLLARDGNSDAQAAYHAVVEGSGTSVMNRWILGHMSEVLKAGLQALEMDTPSLADAPPYVWKPMLASYMRGSAFLVRSEDVLAGQMQVAKAADLDRAFREPPRSTEQVLHPSKYWDAERRDEPQAVGFEVGELPEGWRVLREDTLGELGLGLVTWPLDDRGGLSMTKPDAALRIRYTHGPSMGWGGDRVILLEQDGSFFLQLATAWDTPEDAQEFRDALASLDGHVRSSAAALAREPGTASTQLVVTAPNRVLYTVQVGAGAAALTSAVTATFEAPPIEAAIEASVESAE